MVPIIYEIINSKNRLNITGKHSYLYIKGTYGEYNNNNNVNKKFYSSGRLTRNGKK